LLTLTDVDSELLEEQSSLAAFEGIVVGAKKNCLAGG
jgi:hypothetical protein